MKWKKLGKLFDPTTVSDREWMKAFAQCTSTLVLEDRVRIYFSCRPDKDEDGQAKSYTAFIEVDKNNLFNIINIAKEPVLPLGELGTFDEFAVYPTSVIKEGPEVRLYYAGWTRMKSVPFNTAIGVASSFDGVKFNRLGPGPILSAGVNEPFVLSGPKVRKYNGVWYMFYLAGTKWIMNEGKPEIVYKIRMAMSGNGINWTRIDENIISDVLEENECQAGPDVFYKDDKYHMYFVYRYALDFRDNRDRGYRIGYAYSHNLIDWTRDDKNVGIHYSEPGEWDGDMHHYPHIFELEGKHYMLYNGNEFGKYGFGLAILEND
jgi:predicted GH43/DUF377 family glycosyl hydrolase